MNLLLTINIYNNIYTKTQLDSIIKYCDFENVYIVYNASHSYNEEFLKNFKHNKIKILINPEKINKRRGTGSIFQGIISNFLFFEKQNIDIDFAIILSQRCVFVNEINNEICCDLINNYNINDRFKFNHNTSSRSSANNINKWHWRKIIQNFGNTKIICDSLKKGKLFGGLHEGILINNDAFKSLCNYINNYNKEELYKIYRSKSICEEYMIHNILFLLNKNYISLLLKGDRDRARVDIKNHYKCVQKIWLK